MPGANAYTAAHEAAAIMRQRTRRSLPLRLAGVLVGAVSIGLRFGAVGVGAILLATPLTLAAALAADRYRLNRKLLVSEVARSYATLSHPHEGARRWIGVLSIWTDGIHWTPSKRFRSRGAADVLLSWEDIEHVSAARASPMWLTWFVRNDVLAVEWSGGCLAFAVTSPQAIYKGLRKIGRQVVM